MVPPRSFQPDEHVQPWDFSGQAAVKRSRIDYEPGFMANIWSSVESVHGVHETTAVDQDTFRLQNVFSTDWHTQYSFQNRVPIEPDNTLHHALMDFESDSYCSFAGDGKCMESYISSMATTQNQFVRFTPGDSKTHGIHPEQLEEQCPPMSLVCFGMGGSYSSPS
jgi:hypothetical protein